MKKFCLITSLLSLILTGCGLTRMIPPTPEPVEPLYVGPEQLACANPYRNNVCLQIKQTPEAPWQLYKGNIIGLQYEPGFQYQLEVQKDKTSNPGVDPLDVQWVLYRLISKTKDDAVTSIPKSIQGVAWKLSQYGDPADLAEARGEPGAAILFQSDGHITGSTVCNVYSGIYSIDNDRIQFASLSSSQNRCATPDPLLMKQEQMLLQILQGADHFVLESDKLQIISVGNNRILIFNK
jgi:heat shock protein HslJ